MYISDSEYLVGYDIHIKVYLWYRIRAQNQFITLNLDSYYLTNYDIYIRLYLYF